MASSSSSHQDLKVTLSERTKNKKIGVVTADWNDNVTHSLKEGCVQALKENQISGSQIIERQVPGSFEIPLGAQYLAELGFVQAVVCIGCVIKGETPHFHYIADTVTHKIGDLNLRYGIPFIYGILTVEIPEQAQERAGGEKGNKGTEAGLAALEMLELRNSFYQGKQTPGFRPG